MLVIHRRRQSRDFTQVPNSLARDERLSFGARGYLIELLTHRDGWQANTDQAVAVAKQYRPSAAEGRRAMRSLVAELEALGYAKRERTRDGSAWKTVLHVADDPALIAALGDTASGTPEKDSAEPLGGTASGTPDSPAKTGVSADRSDVPLSGVAGAVPQYEYRSRKTRSVCPRARAAIRQAAPDATDTEIESVITQIDTEHQPGKLDSYVAGFPAAQLADRIQRIRTGATGTSTPAAPAHAGTTPAPPPIAARLHADRCEHGAETGRCALCRAAASPRAS